MTEAVKSPAWVSPPPGSAHPPSSLHLDHMGRNQPKKKLEKKGTVLLPKAVPFAPALIPLGLLASRRKLPRWGRAHKMR